MRLYLLLITAIFFTGACNASENSKHNKIRGIDLNNNGIRDDIDAYIEKQSYSIAQLAAVKQHARLIQAAIVFTSKNREDARVIAMQDGVAIDCIYKAFQSLEAPDNAAAVAQKIESLTANNMARKISYQKFSQLISGMAFQLPKESTCE
jgi:hypothetical protein